MRAFYTTPLYALFLFGWIGLTALSAAPKKPNLIVIMCDDLGYADVSFNVGEGVVARLPTPQIDRITQNGATCTNAYVTYPACGPSRAGFMSGRYQDRFGFNGNPPFNTKDSTVGFPLEEKTLAQAPANPGRPLDGVNLIPYLTGENSEAPHEQLFMRKFDYDSYTIRRGDYKLVIDNARPPELYNVTADIGETKKLNQQYPERVVDLLARIEAWKEPMMDRAFSGEEGED